MADMGDQQRTIGVLGATGVGVGAIVGGGIMVLAGVAYAATGPAALVAFALNGLVAFVTAMSFAEMSSAFPESGGAYTFAKKVLSVRAAFAVGWVLWFAYIVAGVLYALGFAAFAVLALQELWRAAGAVPPEWLAGRRMLLLLSSVATAGYAFSLIRKSAGGGQYATVGKVVVFALIILVGLYAFVRQPLGQSTDALAPFFSGGAAGLFTAMGFTFIALQGFDLVAAIAGEVREPARTVPKAMFLSLTIALAVYLPLLFFISTVGVEPGDTIAALAERQGDTVFAVAVERFMGRPGYWLVIIAAILSTLSALHANLLAASRVAFTMARDHTLPAVLGDTHPQRNTPAMAIYATALTLVAIVFMVPNVGAAGAAASLIFLTSFALTHGTAYLARTRGGVSERGYRTPMFPLIPIAGGLACAALAVFQAIMVPDAGGVMVIWMGLGVILYVALFQRGAETVDASAEALDPHLVKLRGKNPLVLLPIANPANARALVDVANAMAPTQYARVLLLTIIKHAPEEDPRTRLPDALSVVRQALTASYEDQQTPGALMTTAKDPWEEIRRVAKDHACESMLLGLGEIPEEYRALEMKVEHLLEDIDCDVAFLHAPPGWQLSSVQRILIPVGGRGHGHELRARVLGSLCRTRSLELTFLTVLPLDASAADIADARRSIRRLASFKVPAKSEIQVLTSADRARTVLEQAKDHQLIVLGLGGTRWGQKIFGELAMRIAREAPCATMMLSGRRSRAYNDLVRPLRDAVQVLPWSNSRPIERFPEESGPAAIPTDDPAADRPVAIPAADSDAAGKPGDS